MDKLEIGGNKLRLRWGNYLTRVGAKHISKGEVLTVTNPTSKLHSPYLLVINFTVNNTDKYMVALKGDYKERYKEQVDGKDPITVDEMHILIKDKRTEWFLKD
jgi:hypothetical protein